jgi:hypothetical protein
MPESAGGSEGMVGGSGAVAGSFDASLEEPEPRRRFNQLVMRAMLLSLGRCRRH